MPGWRFVQLFGPRRVLRTSVANTAGEITRARPEKRRLLRLDVRSLVWFRLLGDVRRGTTQRRRNRRSASPNFFADVAFVRPRGRRRREKNKGDSAETATSLNYFDATCLRRSRMGTAAGHITEAALPQRHIVVLFRVVNSPSERSIPPEK